MKKLKKSDSFINESTDSYSLDINNDLEENFQDFKDIGTKESADELYGYMRNRHNTDNPKTVREIVNSWINIKPERDFNKRFI
jgi:hypothetical protein